MPAKDGAIDEQTAAGGSRKTPALRHIVRLLTAILLALILAFCFFASSFCITVLLAAFLSILVDPIVKALEKVRLPRSLAIALVILGGTALVGVALIASYNKLNDVADDLPQYAVRIREAVTPLMTKIQQLQDTAGKLDGHQTKKVPEVQVREPNSWASYLARGVGSVWGALVIVCIVPFLMFFMLLAREKIRFCVVALFGSRVNVADFLSKVDLMVRGYSIGNIFIGLGMCAINILVFWLLGLNSPGLLGVVTGLLNLIPFFGMALALAVPLVAALLQFNTPGPFLIIAVTVIALHLIAQNFLLPRFVGPRVDIGPVAATVGILFWSWLWGIAGLLLAIPLTAFVKLVADTSPSLVHLSNFLAPEPHHDAFRLRKLKEKVHGPASDVI